MDAHAIKISVAEVILDVEIEGSFKSIFELLNSFKEENNLKPVARIIIKKSDKRLVIVSDDNREITISGKDIDDLRNPFNLIGILQALFRFAGIHSVAKGIYLLHGSAAVFNGHTICFGDDGTSTAKTLSSIECGLESKEYIGDEFCFFDANSGMVFSYSIIPVHLRPEVEKHLRNKHKFIPPDSQYKKSSAGIFIDPELMFRVIKQKKLDMLVFTHFHKRKPQIRRLTPKESRQAAIVCLTAHLLKLLHPELDRMKFANQEDSDDPVKYRTRIKETLEMFPSLAGAAKDLAERVPCYRIYAHQPCDILELLK